MFVQSESFDLFTAQVLHFTRHSPPITRATVALPASQSAVAAACNPSTRLDSTLLIYTSAGSVQWGREKRRGRERAWQQPSMLLQQHKEQEGRGKEQEKGAGKNRNTFLQILIAHVISLHAMRLCTHTHSHTHLCMPMCLCVCVSAHAYVCS